MVYEDIDSETVETLFAFTDFLKFKSRMIKNAALFD